MLDGPAGGSALQGGIAMIYPRRPYPSALGEVGLTPESKPWPLRSMTSTAELGL
jgi:hypothetical protein